jgi:putative tryptophan/tyrosine transport system substrate-binding protein
VNRRSILRFAIGVGVAFSALPLRAQAPAASIRRIGVLAPSTRAKEEVTLKSFFEEMRRLGWIEGQTIAYDRTYADDRHQDLPRLAAELVAHKPELIYAPPQIAAMAARQATQTIPIVFATGIDPVAAGLVTSLAHPGGNATGVISSIDSLAPKRLELLREILPAAKRIGLLGDPSDPRLTSDRVALAPVASALGLTLIVREASNPVEFDAAVASLMEQRVDAIMAVTSISSNLRERLIELTSRRRVPVVGNLAPVAEVGGLLSYSASIPDQLRRSAQLVDKILKGANPADLPIEQPTKFELVINMKTAKALGITIPQAILLRADEVIQ